MATDHRTLILDAARRCAVRSGLTGLTMEDVAVEAGVSRATLYRVFRTRGDLVRAAVFDEVIRFWQRVADRVSNLAGIHNQLEVGLVEIHRLGQEDPLYQQLLADDPDELLSAIAETTPLVFGAIRDHLDGLLAVERLAPGCDRAAAADYLARMVLSYASRPGGWNPDDPEATRRLVRTQFLAGILA